VQPSPTFALTNYSNASDLQTTMPSLAADNGAVTFNATGNETSRQLLCNGLANICDLRLPDVLIPMVHNSMSSTADGFSIANHNLPLEDALKAGYRGFNLDVCDCGGRMVFCHALCILGSREIVEILGNLYRFLEANPHEVLVFSFQIDNDESGRPQDLNELYGIMETIGHNFTKMIYVHDPEVGHWPTLRTLIETNKVSREFDPLASSC
jgi:hypothetical protein